MGIESNMMRGNLASGKVYSIMKGVTKGEEVGEEQFERREIRTSISLLQK